MEWSLLSSMLGKRMGDSQVPLSTDASSVMTDWTMCVPQPALLYMVQRRSTSVALRFRPVYAAFPNAPLKRPQAPLIYAPYHRYHHRKLPISRAERVMPDPPTQRCPAPVLLPALPSRRAASSGWLLGLRHHRPDERHAPASTAAGHRSGQLRARDHERHGGARYTSRRPAPRSSDARTGRPCADVLIGSRAPFQCAAPMTRARANWRARSAHQPAPDRATRRSHDHSLALRVRNRSHTHQAARTGSRHATHTITRNTRRTHRQRSAQREQARCRRCSRAPAPVAHRRHLRQALALSAPHRVPRYSQRSTTGQRRASEFACIPGLCLNPSLPLSLCASCL
jgi:hypothetical protein